MKDNLHTGPEVREKLMSGITKVATAVGATMGTGGSNAILEALENPGHLMTNDGYSIANSVYLADPIEDMGRKILLESINRANKASGDGSSTTAVLTAAILEEGDRHIGDTSVMDIKRSLEHCIPIIEANILAQKRDLIDKDGVLDYTLLEQVATISSEDEGIGQTIAEIYVKIGKTGIIHWDISKTPHDTYTVGSGLTVEGASLYSPYLADATDSGQNSNQVRLKNPRVLLTKQKITSAAELGDLGQELYKQNIKDLVVLFDDIDPLVVADIIKTRMVRGFRFVLVKMPVLWKDEWFADLALASGATVIDAIGGLSLKNATCDHLGTFENITITRDDTFIDGIKSMSDHLQQLATENTDESVLRASRLNTKTARYFVGAHSDSALSYRRLKVEDAISAAWQALNGGVVAGGGSALVEAAYGLPLETVGGKILDRALRFPAHQIATNAGHPEITIGADYRNGIGYNSKTNEFVDMFEAGIVDPANVVINACKNAISVAAAILTASTIVTLPRQETEAQNPNIITTK